MLLTLCASPSLAALSETLRATVQLSDFRWGDVQVAQLRWQRFSDDESIWKAHLQGVRYGETPLGEFVMDCMQASKRDGFSCRNGRWQWQSPVGERYQGSIVLDREQEHWLVLKAEGMDVHVSGHGDALRWQLSLAVRDLSHLLDWWPQSLPLQPLLWRGSLSLTAHGGTDSAHVALNLDAMDFDSEDGRVASGALTSGLVAEISREGTRWQIEAQGNVGPGAVLWNDLYLDLGQRQARFELALNADTEQGRWQVQNIAWHDAPSVRLQGHGLWDQGALQQIQINELAVDLAALTPNYLSGWLARAALSGLQLTGTVRGSLDWREQQPRDFHLQLAEVAVKDAAGRFAVKGFSGDVRLDGGSAIATRDDKQTAAQPMPAPAKVTNSYLRWHEISLLGLTFDAGEIRGYLTSQAFRLNESTRLPLLDGALRLDHLHLRRATDDSDWNVDLRAELEPVSMARLTDVFGWPSFGGKVGGRLPGVSYEAGVLRLDGALDFEIFNGHVRLRNLALERPFGSLPSMNADLTVDALDLEPLTQAFSFGRITGQLSGTVNNLRLLDWQPVAFDAQFATLDRGGRISQRAVDNLSRIGGGGGAALSGIVGALFDEFPYKELGLACRLENNICYMNGVKPSPDDNAYYIVVGRGLPRITIKGFQRQVDWPRLVNQLKQIITGAGSPQIR